MVADDYALEVEMEDDRREWDLLEGVSLRWKIDEESTPSSFQY